MIRGLVIGKFLPIHQGHIALINFAGLHCDELIVSMSYTADDPIDAHLRFSWIQKLFSGRDSVKPFMIEDNFDKDELPVEDRTQIWAQVMRQVYPSIDVLFSSEDYSIPFAKHLGAKNVIFDLHRHNFKVSATLIREDPFRNWAYIPEVVRPHFVKKICFFGPESTGKTVMAEKMALEFNTTWVPEVAREMITSNDFTAADIVRIGEAHLQRITDKLESANKLLIIDTDAITTQIYSRHYLNIVPDVLIELERKIKFDHYFLFDIDVPWVPDGLRDLGERRREMFGIFRDELSKRKVPYTLVQGTFQFRETIVRNTLNKLLSA